MGGGKAPHPSYQDLGAQNRVGGRGETSASDLDTAKLLSALKVLEGQGPVGWQWTPKPLIDSNSDVESLAGFTPAAGQTPQSGTPHTGDGQQWRRGGWQGSQLVASSDRSPARPSAAFAAEAESESDAPPVTVHRRAARGRTYAAASRLPPAGATCLSLFQLGASARHSAHL